MKALEDMTVAQLKRELEKLDKRRSKNCSDFIAVGRGFEPPSKYLKKEDTLSLEARAIADRYDAIRHAMRKRQMDKDFKAYKKHFGG